MGSFQFSNFHPLFQIVSSVDLWRDCLSRDVPLGNWERHGDLVLLDKNHFASTEWAEAEEQTEEIKWRTILTSFSAKFNFLALQFGNLVHKTEKLCIG
jgi:hypothetical protein